MDKKGRDDQNLNIQHKGKKFFTNKDSVITYINIYKSFFHFSLIHKHSTKVYVVPKIVWTWFVTKRFVGIKGQNINRS